MSIYDPEGLSLLCDYEKLSYNQLLEKCVKQELKIKKLENSRKVLKFDYDCMCKRIIEHRKQITYKDETINLYKNILFDKFGGRKCNS